MVDVKRLRVTKANLAFPVIALKYFKSLLLPAWIAKPFSVGIAWRSVRLCRQWISPLKRESASTRHRRAVSPACDLSLSTSDDEVPGDALLRRLLEDLFRFHGLRCHSLMPTRSHRERVSNFSSTVHRAVAFLIHPGPTLWTLRRSRPRRLSSSSPSSVWASDTSLQASPASLRARCKHRS